MLTRALMMNYAFEGISDDRSEANFSELTGRYQEQKDVSLALNLLFQQEKWILVNFATDKINEHHFVSVSTGEPTVKSIRRAKNSSCAYLATNR